MKIELFMKHFLRKCDTRVYSWKISLSKITCYTVKNKCVPHAQNSLFYIGTIVTSVWHLVAVTAFLKSPYSWLVRDISQYNRFIMLESLSNRSLCPLHYIYMYYDKDLCWTMSRGSSLCLWWDWHLPNLQANKTMSSCCIVLVHLRVNKMTRLQLVSILLKSLDNMQVWYT